MNHIWYQNAIFYSLDVETFYDANGDGIGDFQGLIYKLDYISGLGVNCIWLLPFYPSPNRDNGYDVMDYYNIDSRLGTLGDFAEFLDKATQLGIRVIIDLVVNHTSIQHPWFEGAARNTESRYHNYYVWSDEPQEHKSESLMLSGEVNTVWTYHEQAGKYYLHRFYKEQPDLNIANPEVRLEILRVMGFWLRLGVSGFRIDAAEILIEPYGIKDTGEYNLSCFMEEMREFIALRKSDAILLAETNVLPEKMKTYMHKGERMHMVFNFYLNQQVFLALAERKSDAIYQALDQSPNLRHNQLLNFLRHHDELSLKLLSENQRNTIYQEFAPDENMRIFGKGIRRRLAPMLGGNRPVMELAFSLAFTLPGTPLIRYGDEIGMGEDLSLPGRESVRTPMQWTEAREAGFSATGKNAIYPVISEGEFGYESVNVRKQQQDRGSFLNWIQRLIVARKQFPEIGSGNLQAIPTDNSSVLVHSFKSRGSTVYFFHNLSNEQASLDLGTIKLDSSSLFEAFGDELSKQVQNILQISPYGYKWYKSNT